MKRKRFSGSGTIWRHRKTMTSPSAIWKRSSPRKKHLRTSCPSCSRLWLRFPLIVGGIGIMNIMLVSVRERTREIGLRQAVGAKTRDILTQFLVEAVALSIAGGCAGIVLGIAASAVISRLAGWNTVVSVGAVALAVFFSALVGISFGYYPARKAAYLDPIEALRSE